MKRTIARFSGRLFPQKNPSVVTSRSDISVFVGRNPTNRANMPQHDEHISLKCRLPIQTRFTVRASAEKQSLFRQGGHGLLEPTHAKDASSRSTRIQPKSSLPVASDQFTNPSRLSSRADPGLSGPSRRRADMDESKTARRVDPVGVYSDWLGARGWVVPHSSGKS
jgi:hypothetical protein